jgi:hypothetical protein
MRGRGRIRRKSKKFITVMKVSREKGSLVAWVAQQAHGVVLLPQHPLPLGSNMRCVEVKEAVRP